MGGSLRCLVRGGGVLYQRLLSAFILIPVILLAAYMGGWWYVAFALVAAILCIYEFNVILRHANFKPWLPLLFALTAALVLAGYFWTLAYVQIVLAAALILVSAWQLATPAEERSLSDWSATIAPAVYLGWLGASVLLVRNVPQGWRWTLFLYLTVFAADSAAYFGGRAFGRHPFAPTVSPKKTWEGAIIGWAYTTFLAVGLARFLQLPMNAFEAAALGLAVGIVSAIGDLTMSFVKRQAHVKDASHLIPGHGGLLDRVDSILPAAAVVAAYIQWFVR